MYVTGDFITSTQRFDSDSWGPATARFMEHIVEDLKEKQWDSIFRALRSFSVKMANEEAVRNGVSATPRGKRVPLPPSDPPSPARSD